MFFSSGNSERDRNLLANLKKLEPGFFVFPIIKSLDLYLAVLNGTNLFISGDTASLDFSHALGVRVIGLFGIYGSMQYAAPIYQFNQKVTAMTCLCTGHLEHFENYRSKKSCMNSIQPKEVLNFSQFKKIKNPQF